MINLNRENCHNFSMAEKLGRCSFISVCESDCVFVWKAYYDSKKEQDADQVEIEELKEKISDLESEIQKKVEKNEKRVYKNVNGVNVRISD